MVVNIVVSGGFDPVHIGHLRMFKAAKEFADKEGDGYLIVIVNNDNWIKLKKGKPFMKDKDRKEIIEAFECVDEVMLSFHKKNTKDMSVCRELEKLDPHIFANGGDRKIGNVPEYETCQDNNIRMIFNIGGKKLRSSSDLIKGGN